MTRMLGLPLEVRSKPGHGSVFSIKVKLTNAKASTPLLTSNAQGQTLEHLKVVCVDDDEVNNRAMEFLLKRWGITSIVSFQDGDGAVDYAQTHCQPDVVIIDYQLGSTENGLEVYDRLLELWPNQPGIMVSAAPIADLGRAANARGLHFLPKPIKPAALRAFMTQITLISSNL
jgi:CheY-like chemotaxis protein